MSEQVSDAERDRMAERLVRAAALVKVALEIAEYDAPTKIDHHQDTLCHFCNYEWYREPEQPHAKDCPWPELEQAANHYHALGDVELDVYANHVGNANRGVPRQNWHPKRPNQQAGRKAVDKIKKLLV